MWTGEALYFCSSPRGHLHIHGTVRQSQRVVVEYTLIMRIIDMFSFMHVSCIRIEKPRVCMLILTQWSFINFERSRADIGLGEPDGPALVRFADWLVHTGLFEQAWAAVCFGESPWSWWWSQQLCLFTAGAWTVLLTVEGEPSYR